MSKLGEAVNTLNSQLYNATITGCGLSPDLFQLGQGAIPQPTDSTGFWRMFNVVPPKTATTYYNPSQANVFSDDYGAVLSHLLPQGSDRLKTDLGDWYDAWTTAKMAPANAAWPIDMSASDYFKAWAPRAGVPDAIATKGYADLLAMEIDPITVALQAFINAGGGKKELMAYNNTIDNLNLASGPSKKVSMNSATQSSDISHTWAKAEASGGGIFWGGSVSTSYDSLAEKFTNAGLQVEISYDNLVTFTAAPLSNGTINSGPKTYNPWYSGNVLNNAFNDSSNSMWDHGSPNWNSTFGDTGNMQRMTTSCIVVDGITSTVTSSAGLSKSDQESFAVAASGGWWPFFSSTSSGGWSQSNSFDDSGNLTSVTQSPTGNPIILGFLVTPAPEYLGG
jgi:hypothetical protein